MIGFKALGSDHPAYSGKLAHTWGSVLVEPPAMANLRRLAGSKITTLGDLAPPRGGIPTRVVHYFMVEEVTDEETRRAVGINTGSDRRRLALVEDGRGSRHLLERAVLRPVVRRPGSLEGRLGVGVPQTGTSLMFSTTLNMDELKKKRFAHTLEYIRYGETTDFPAREGSRRKGGVPSERPQVRVRPVWYQVPQIPQGPGRVCWIKGRGSRHYAPVLGDGILVPDNFQFSAPPADLERPEMLGAVANLSFTHLMTEVFGRRSGGDGVLHTYIRELRQLPIVDPRQLTVTQTDDLMEKFEPILGRPALTINEELLQSDRQAFDLLAMRFLFDKETATEAAVSTSRYLRQLAGERQNRYQSGREQQRRAVRRGSFNADMYAARAIHDAGSGPSIGGALPSEGDVTTLTVDIPRHAGEALLEVGESLFDSDAVNIGSSITIQTPSPSHARIIYAVLRRHSDTVGPMVLPVDEDAAHAAADVLQERWREWSGLIKQAVVEMLPGRNQAEQRNQTIKAIERAEGIWPGSLS